VAGIFDGPDDPEGIEESYINQVVPSEARELWDVSIENSPTWDSYSAEDHMYLADIFADAVFQGDFDSAEEFLEYLEIDWDESDIRSFYEAYEAISG
jgi:hypothetical protein